MAGMKSSLATRAAAMPAAGARPPASLYVAGPFSMGYVDFFTFLIPLYGLSLGLDAAEIGVLVGARSILAAFLSIHIGVPPPVRAFAPVPLRAGAGRRADVGG